MQRTNHGSSSPVSNNLPSTMIWASLSCYQNEMLNFSSVQYFIYWWRTIMKQVHRWTAAAGVSGRRPSACANGGHRRAGALERRTPSGGVGGVAAWRRVADPVVLGPDPAAAGGRRPSARAHGGGPAAPAEFSFFFFLLFHLLRRACKPPQIMYD